MGRNDTRSGLQTPLTNDIIFIHGSLRAGRTGKNRFVSSTPEPLIRVIYDTETVLQHRQLCKDTSHSFTPPSIPNEFN